MTDNYMKKLKDLLIFEKNNLIKNGVTLSYEKFAF